MADADNLDTLSNAEIRAQMLAQGLPNIPVTDSSRKVLVKRLRASLGGNAVLPAATASPKKTSARRETLQPAVAPTATPAAQVDKPDGGNAAAKSRRTIAYTPSDTKEAERRRQPASKPETVAPLPRVPQATAPAVQPVAVAAAAAVAAPKVAAIKSRRLSTAERVSKQPETIAEEPAVPKQQHNENTLLVNSLIILESDEEEDEQLAQAAQSAEDQYRHSKKSAKPMLSASTTIHHEYVNKQALYPTLDPSPTLEQQRFKQIYDHAPSPSQPRAALATGTGHYDYRAATSGRYSSYVSSPGASYTGAAATSAASLGASSYRRSPPRTFSNEFSDDAAEEDAAQGVKFESDFARNLARLRAERIGDRSSPFRRTIAGGVSASGSITGARRSLRPENASPGVAITRWCRSLDRKYNLKSKIFILIVGLLLYGAYRYFY